MSGDIAVGVTAILPGTAVAKKPSYLILLEEKKGMKKFITLDKPEIVNGFVQVKGMFCDSSEEEISKSFVDILTSAKRELIIEVYLPWHKICSMKSLVFKAK